MPRLTITLPKDIYEKIQAVSGEQEESMSFTIAKMTELGLLVTENQKNNNGVKKLSEIEEHCFKLIIQMNAIIKNMAAKNLDFAQEEFDKLRDSSILKFNELTGIKQEEL